MNESVRERRRQRVREDVLDAVRELLSTKGYSQISVDEIAALAGISKPTLYSYFDTKETVVVAALLREFEQLGDMLAAPLEQTTPLERMTQILRAVLQTQLSRGHTTMHPNDLELVKLLFAHERSKTCMRELETAAKSLVQAAITCGEIDPAYDVYTVVRVFFSMANSIRLPMFMPPDGPAFIDTIVALWRRGVAPR